MLEALFAQANCWPERHFFVPVQPDVDLSQQEGINAITFNPQDYLIGTISEAIDCAADSDGVSASTGAGRKLLFLEPLTQQAIYPSAPQLLEAIGNRPLIHNDIQIECFPYVEAFSGQSFGCEHLENILWKFMLWASHGRVPIGTNFETKICLKKTPELNRLVPIPFAKRVFDLWSGGRCSLIETLKELGLPQSYVFALYSAGQALGAISVEDGCT